MNEAKYNQTLAKPENEKWFDDLVATLRVHELELATDTATDERRHFYDKLMYGSRDEIALMNKRLIQQHFVGKIIFEYLTQLGSELPRKLAFDFNDSVVLVWAQIEDDDEQMENRLIMTEAKINAKFHDFGFDMESTIVEAGDSLDVPNHYSIFKE